MQGLSILIGMNLFCLFSLIFLSSNSFFPSLLCSIFCSKLSHFAQSLAMLLAT